MTLLGEVDTLADDIVATVLYLGNKGSPLPVLSGGRGEAYPVAYCNRICAPYATQTEITLDLTINKLAIVRTDGVPASSILNN
jgi:hypothetical protein